MTDLDPKQVFEIISKEYVGKDFMVRSNEDEPLWAGVLVRFDKDMYDKQKSFFPVIRSYHDDKEYMVFGLVMPLNEDLFEFLGSLTPKKQWDIFADMKVYWSYTKQ